ncbi:MAG: amidohydrolase family protein [Candidatus Buchananbacteria bacterium]
MIIDMHAHTSRHQMKGLHTADADLDDLREYAKMYYIKVIVLMATYFPLKGTGLSNLDLHERIMGDSLFRMFGSLDLSADKPSTFELEVMADAGSLSGFKLYPGYQKFELDCRAVGRICRLAQEYDLPIAMHLGELYHCCPKDVRVIGQGRCGRPLCPLDERAHLANPERLRLLALRYPEVNFIACHLANPYFDILRQVMIDCPNVMTDISGQFVSGSSEDTPEYRKFITSQIKQFIELPNGIDRIMFATDFPIQSYRDTLEIVASLNLSPDDENKILGGNAQRLLKISW